MHRGVGEKTRRITGYVHRHDLVRVGRRSRRPCVLLSMLACLFLFLFGKRIIDVFLGLARFGLVLALCLDLLLLFVGFPDCIRNFFLLCGVTLSLEP